MILSNNILINKQNTWKSISNIYHLFFLFDFTSDKKKGRTTSFLWKHMHSYMSPIKFRFYYTFIHSFMHSKLNI